MDFNDLVSQLETNFGLVTTGHLRLWQRELKSQEARDINERFKELEQPVFTQAMSDNGELPEKGVKCQGYVLAETKTQGQPCNKWIEGYFIKKAQAPNGGMCFLFESAGGHSYILNAESHIKPIDTRTDKEKAVDDIRKITMPDKLTEVEWDIVAAIRSGQITGVKWVGE